MMNAHHWGLGRPGRIVQYVLSGIGLLLPLGSAAQEASLVGAWRVVERSYERGDSSWVVSDPQPGLYLFTDTHYGVQEIRESRQRPLFSSKTSLCSPTQGDKLSDPVVRSLSEDRGRGAASRPRTAYPRR